MKRLTEKQRLRTLRISKKRLARRRRKFARHEITVHRMLEQQSRRLVVDAFSRGKFGKMVARNGVISEAPENFSISDHPRESLQFLSGMRRSLLDAAEERKKRKTKVRRKRPVIDGFFDMSTIKEISTSNALILAAEYDRIKQHESEAPPLINLTEWAPEIVHKLSEIGFFKALNIDPKFIPGAQSVGNNDVMTVEFYSGIDANELREADKGLFRLAEHIGVSFEEPTDLSLALSSAISEAMTNVRMHAYVDWHDFEFPHIHKWWMSGASKKSTGEMVICMYDQGASIPVTYKQKEWHDVIKSYVAGLASSFGVGANHDYVDDGILISAAAKYGRSQTGDKHRGKGLPQMKQAIDICEGGRLMIVSRGGRYIYEAGNKEKIDAFEHSVGGTLIEWKLSIGENSE